MALHGHMLRYIEEVARSGSVRAAGARLHVSPSAINRQILIIERELGEVLFERLPRGMRPTLAGEILIAHIRETNRRYRATITEMRDLRALPSGEVGIATMTGLASSMVSVAAASFAARYPQVQVTIKIMGSVEIQRAIENSEVDLGLGFNIPESGQLSVLWQQDARFGVVISPKHPLAALEAVPLQQAAAFPLIFADRSMVLHEIVAQAFAAMSIKAEHTFHTNSVEAMKRLAGAGNAVAFLSKYDIAEELRDARLAYRPVWENSFRSNLLSCVQRGSQANAPALAIFAEAIIAELEEITAFPTKKAD